MKTASRQPASRPAPSRELAGLRARLAEAEETLRAIRRGEVDAVVVESRQGLQVFTLEGAEHAYRVLIESMNEGALTLTADAVILYANQCFARMVKRPLEQVLGCSFYTFLGAADQAALRALLKRVAKSGAKTNCRLQAGDGSQMPARISIRALAGNGATGAAAGLVVTDMTEARQNEATLRDLTNQLVQAQETERGRVANELRVNITQLLYVTLGRCETLAKKLHADESSACGDTARINEMLRKTAEEVERVWRSVWCLELEKVGLVIALEKAAAEFMERTGISIQIDCPPLAERLPAKAELALYRIFQKALDNVERHAHARHATVRLTQSDVLVQLTIQDDGRGFKPGNHLAQTNENGGLELLWMRERAACVGGVLSIKSTPRAGTEIQVRIPLPPNAGGGLSR